MFNSDLHSIVIRLHSAMMLACANMLHSLDLNRHFAHQHLRVAQHDGVHSCSKTDWTRSGRSLVVLRNTWFDDMDKMKNKNKK